MKQVILIRRDLKMRRGKEIAQGSHASMAWMTKRLRRVGNGPDGCGVYELFLSEPEEEWVNGSFRKVTLQVKSEEELLEIYNKAKAANLVVELITDNGTTEFGGTPTNTAIAIGPDTDENIDKITGNLDLY